MRSVLTLTLLVASSDAAAFAVNGRVWPQMPIPYYVNPQGAPVDETDLLALIAQAAEAWESVPCANVQFEFMGTTTSRFADDGQNVIYWANDVWQEANPSAAAATLWVNQGNPDAPLQVDLALNSVNFEWVIGGADALAVDVVDPVAVIMHELGHWLGLAHSADQFATMYQAMLPNAVQTSLEADDKWGLCSLYPTGVDECAVDADCAGDRLCAEQNGIAVCTDRHDPTGAACSKDKLNCEGMCFISLYECSSLCAFENLTYTQGYCAPLCTDTPCPDGWVCTDLAQYDSNVCLKSEAPADENASAGSTEPAPTVLPEPAGSGNRGCAAASPLSTLITIGAFALRLADRSLRAGIRGQDRAA